MKEGIEHGPLLEHGMITAGLDYYKPTMSQLAYEIEPEAEVTFAFINRGKERLLDYLTVEELQDRFDYIRSVGFQPEELEFLAKLNRLDGSPVFSKDYLDTLAQSELPEVLVTHEEATDDLSIETTGQWPHVTFWETVIMSEVNETYFENYVRSKGIDLFEVYEEGNARLTEKIEILKANPGIKFSDFGTRRHFSLRWQKHVLDRLKTECPDNLLGTSNVALANTMGLKPIGTFAHEMPMVYAGLADGRGQNIRQSHGNFLNDWADKYGDDLSIALTDTFGSKFFFEDFTDEQAQQWAGLRHDSGDPIEFGERAIEFYQSKGIDPTTKTIVFSDSLNIDTIVKLYRHFEGRIGRVFGWGGNLMNDLGIPALNIVAKAVKVNGRPTVKLSDNPGKVTGPVGVVRLYQDEFCSRKEAVVL